MVSILIVLGLALGLSWLFTRPLLDATLRFNARCKGRLSHMGMDVTASELAQHMIDGVGLAAFVKLGKRGDSFGQDFYDSDTAEVNLTSRTTASKKLLDGFIACHEVGHAVMDHSSRLLKIACDLAANAISPRLTLGASIAFAASAIIGWTLGMNLAVLVLGVQLLAAIGMQAIEARASHYGLLVMEQLFDLAPEVRSSLTVCAHTAQVSQTAQLGVSAALILVFSQLTAYAASPLLVVPACALLLYACLFASSWLRSSER